MFVVATFCFTFQTLLSVIAFLVATKAIIMSCCNIIVEALLRKEIYDCIYKNNEPGKRLYSFLQDIDYGFSHFLFSSWLFITAPLCFQNLILLIFLNLILCIIVCFSKIKNYFL